MRRLDLAGLGLAVAMAMLACSSTPAPPMHYHQLRLSPPVAAPAATVAPAAVAPAAVAQGAWQLMLPIRGPDYLDRDTLWVAAGGNSLQPLDGHRWAEPLRAAVPRTLGHDLGVLHGAGQVWSGAVPEGMVVTRQWRVELLEFAPSEGRPGVRLRARWVVRDPRSDAVPVQTGEADVDAPSAGAQPDQLVDAYRLALWRLAERMAGSAAGP